MKLTMRILATLASSEGWKSIKPNLNHLFTPNEGSVNNTAIKSNKDNIKITGVNELIESIEK